ncbi:FUSC family protein [Nocardioides jejuensis]|uniref:FUSC family protein n=1 Tax=Nocardioides jejuensis TaxID=2502782 RepID=A0A4R1BTN4_9ACTN|nr:FUSC family protein [Nocardioides jejuensis]TCJ21249.1 FUSC family protein [Nocardioides jejuensis]
MELPPLDLVRTRGRTSAAARVRRLQSKAWHVGQCAVAAALAWFVAADLLGHHVPFFAPVAAVVALGTSYGQRLRRVAEVAVGVALGVFIGDMFVLAVGSGGWQIGVVVAVAMTTALLLDGGQLIVAQSAVQSIIVVALASQTGTGQPIDRWIDALVGGAFALLAAAVVPAAPLRRPGEQAAVVVRKVAALLRAAADVMVHGEVEPALALLADARGTDRLVRELRAFADEAVAVTVSPLQHRHRDRMKQMVSLAEPVDKALRTTRVLVRRTAVAAYHRAPVPSAYAEVCRELADAADLVASALGDGSDMTPAREALLAVGHRTSALGRSHALSVEVVLAMLRGLTADLLELTGMSPLEATDALPLPSRTWLDGEDRADNA